MATDATLVLDIDSSGAVGAAKALAGLNKYAAATATMSAKLSAAFRDTGASLDNQLKYIAKNEQEIRKLAASYNPALAAQLKLAEAQKEVARAVQLGVIPVDRQADVLRELQRQLLLSTTAQSSFSGGMLKGTAQVQNFGYQIGDFAVQVASGQNAVMALSQQLPQLLGGFGAIGAVAGAVTAIMGAAWMVMGAGQTASQKLERSMDNLSSAAENVSKANDILRKSSIELFAEYGAGGRIIEQAAKTLRDLEVQRATSSFSETLKLAREQFQGFGVDAAKYAENVAIVERASENMTRRQLEQFKSAGTIGIEIDAANEKILALSERLGTSFDSATRLAGAFYDLSRSRSIEQSASAMDRVNGIIKSAGISFEKLPKELQEAISSGAQLNFRLAQIKGDIDGATGATAAWAANMSSVLGFVRGIASGLSAISGRGIEFASVQAEIDAIKAGKKLQDAAHIGRMAQIRAEGAVRTAELERERGIVGKIQGIFEQQSAVALLNKQQELAALQDIAREREKESVRGGGAAARELKAAEKGFQSLRELLEKESVFQVAEWEKRQAQLVTALERGLITRKQYAELESQLQINYFGTEYQQRQLNYELSHQQLVEALERELITRQQYAIMAGNLHSQQVSMLGAQDANRYSNDLANLSKHFGEMNQLAGGGYDKLLKAQRVFAAGSALISTYTGAAKALELPFPYNLAAAGKVIAAGFGFISAIKSGSSGGGGSAQAAATQTQAATQTPPTRYVNISLDGLTTRDAELIESVISEIESQSKDGRKIIFNRG